MDFAKLDLKSASEQGSWVQLEHDKAPLFLDDDADTPVKPCQLHIRGMVEKGVMEACKSVTRLQTLMQDRLARASDKDAEGVLKGFDAKVQSATEEMIVAAVDDWQNIQWDGEPLEFNRENLLKICGPRTLFFAQVSAAILEHKRLFTKAGTD